MTSTTTIKINTTIRILCLHGYKQNADVFRAKIGSWRKSLKKHNIEFICINAPHHSSIDTTSTMLLLGDSTTPRTWWLNDSPSSSWDASCEEITRALEQHAPIHVLMGFSQGATAAATYVKLNSQSTSSTSSGRVAQLRGLVCISGGPSSSSSSSSLVCQHQSTDTHTCKNQPPVLCVMGENDDVVPTEASKALMEYYCCCSDDNRIEYLVHSGGHGVPSLSTGEMKDRLLSFLFKCNSTEVPL
jgi:predicted esterase